MAIRCKMQLENVVASVYGGAKAIFRCSYDPKLIAEDVTFSKATPCGFAEYQIDNPAAVAQLKIGEYYYVDFSEVPKPPPQPEPVHEAAPQAADVPTSAGSAAEDSGPKD